MFTAARGEGHLLFGLNNPNRNWFTTRPDDIYPCSLITYSDYLITENLLRSFFQYFDQDLRNVWKEEIREDSCIIRVHETIPGNCPANDICNGQKHMSVIIDFPNVN